jgi:hypothetical protein
MIEIEFQDRCLKLLGHPSMAGILGRHELPDRERIGNRGAPGKSWAQRQEQKSGYGMYFRAGFRTIGGA